MLRVVRNFFLLWGGVAVGIALTKDFFLGFILLMIMTVIVAAVTGVEEAKEEDEQSTD